MFICIQAYPQDGIFGEQSKNSIEVKVSKGNEVTCFIKPELDRIQAGGELRSSVPMEIANPDGEGLTESRSIRITENFIPTKIILRNKNSKNEKVTLQYISSNLSQDYGLVIKCYP